MENRKSLIIWSEWIKVKEHGNHEYIVCKRIRDYSFNTFVKFSKKLTSLTPDMHMYVRVSRGTKC